MLLSGDAAAQPKAGYRNFGPPRVEVLHQMGAMLLTGPDEPRKGFRGSPCGGWCAERHRFVLAIPPLRTLRPSTHGATKYLKRLVSVAAPELVDRHGVGTETTGALLWPPATTRNGLDGQAFAHFWGKAPIERPSGTVVRKRLNRGGNRFTNSVGSSTGSAVTSSPQYLILSLATYSHPPPFQP
jgi:hypothetical protein